MNRKDRWSRDVKYYDKPFAIKAGIKYHQTKSKCTSMKEQEDNLEKKGICFTETGFCLTPKRVFKHVYTRIEDKKTPCQFNNNTKIISKKPL